MEIIFNYNGKELTYRCQNVKEKVNDIFHYLRNDIDINLTKFLYSGKQIDGNLPISKINNNKDNERKKINILVTKNNNELNPTLIYSKDIICPKCGESAKLDIAEYKILIQCINGHNTRNIFLKDYKETQKLDISKILCDKCKMNNKSNSYNNIFYRCNQCKVNLCLFCKNKHEHNCINYDYKNYICNIHNERYISYYKKCKKNICLSCRIDHEEHELINYENILPNLN